MLSCLIIDDEPLARDILSAYIEADADLCLAGSLNNAADAFIFLKKHPVDILFLDIEMPEMSGINFLRSLDKRPITIFTTAYRDYAVEGFELGVMDFLLKPISRERFQLAIQKITGEFIFVKSGVERIKLYFADVVYIQGLKDYAIIHTDKGKIVTKGSVKYMLELFPGRLFIRVHKSFIVSKNRIERITHNNHIIIGPHQIPIGRNYKEDLTHSGF